MTEIERVDIDKLVIDSAQSRSQQSWGSDESDQQLVESIAEDGVMNPLMVRPVEMTPFDDDIDEDYSVIAGSRRFKASVEAGLSVLPCQVIEATDLEAAIKSLKENKERKNLTEQERMMSIKLHYEILGGDELKEEYECQQCDSVFESIRTLSSHTATKSEHDPLEVSIPSSDSVQTRWDAVAFIADKHYPDMKKSQARHKVRSMLDAVELPDDYLVLLTDPESRSETEKNRLEELGIDPTREFTLSGSGDFSSIINLYQEVDQISGLEADRRVLSAIGDVDFEQPNHSLSDEIDQIRESFLDETEDVESAEEMERAFEDTVTDTQQRLMHVYEEVGMDTIGNVQLSFEDQKFKRYHALAKQQQKIKNNSEIVRIAYEKYLDNLSEKHGW
jgi:hypothetical protein